MGQTGTEKRRAGYWPALVRVIWSILALLAVGLVTYGVVMAYAFLHALHTAPLCEHCVGRIDPLVERWKFLPAAGRRPVLVVPPWLDGYVLYSSMLGVICALSYLSVGGVLVWRKPGDWMALFVAFFFVPLAVAFCPELPVQSSLWQPLVSQMMDLGLTCLFLFFCLFPGGRLVPWWSYCLVALAILHYGIQIVLQVSSLLVASFLDSVNGTVEVILVAGIALVQIYRYRRVSDPVQKRQTKWVVFGGCSAAILYLVEQLATRFHIFDISYPLLGLFAQHATIFVVLLLIPFSIGIAILRSRLWNIDLIIHRTLVYGTLSACVVGLYILVVGGLGTLLQAQGNVLISLLATGLIAALFHPLRERLQHAVNYLVYGERNDPYLVLSRLSRRLETTPAPDKVLATIIETVAQAFKLPYAAITLKQGDQFVPGAVCGQAGPEEELLHLALTYQGELLGELILASDTPGEAFSATDRRLLEDLARHAGAAVHAVRLGTAIQRSREQLVTAREEERRRLRRDLHDGLGPQLASLMLVLTAVRKLLRSDPTAAEQTLTEAMRHLQEAIRDIRRLVYGLRPPALDGLGLLAALQEEMRRYQASGVAFTLVAPESLPPLPAAVEVACYRIVQEALTNVVGHAQASHCTVHLAIDEFLNLEVTDDGKGLPPVCKSGIGLTSMRERAQELGGICSIGALATGGTRVATRLPLGEEELCGERRRKEI